MISASQTPESPIETPAFPFVSHGGVHEHQFCFGGLSMRQYAAIHIMAGLVQRTTPMNAEHTAEDALRYADALLKLESETRK